MKLMGKEERTKVNMVKPVYLFPTLEADLEKEMEIYI